MVSELIKYLIWTFGELEPERKEKSVVFFSAKAPHPGDEEELNDYLSESEDIPEEDNESTVHSINDPSPEFKVDQSLRANEISQTKPYETYIPIDFPYEALSTLNVLPANEFFLDDIISQFNNEFETFFSKLMDSVESQDDFVDLFGLKNSIYKFYLYLILPDLKHLIEDKKIISKNDEQHPEIKRLLTKIFFLTSFTYEVMSGNINSIEKAFNRIPGKKIKEKRMLSYIMITRMIMSEGFSERFCIRKFSQQLDLFDSDQNEIDHDKYENFVKAYNKWKNDNSKYHDIIIESIKQGMSDENILQKIRTLAFN